MGKIAGKRGRKPGPQTNKFASFLKEFRLKNSSLKLPQKTISKMAGLQYQMNKLANGQALQEVQEQNEFKQEEEKLEQEIIGKIAKIRNSSFEDISGLHDVKKLLRVFVLLPNLRPELQNRIKQPRGILLFGPPGTGKPNTRSEWHRANV